MAENIKDRDERGRTATGERAGNTVYSDEKARSAYASKRNGQSNAQIISSLGVRKGSFSYLLERGRRLHEGHAA